MLILSLSNFRTFVFSELVTNIGTLGKMKASSRYSRLVTGLKIGAKARKPLKQNQTNEPTKKTPQNNNNKAKMPSPTKKTPNTK